jgi:hypothetical protein
MRTIRKEYVFRVTSGDLGLELECEFPRRPVSLTPELEEHWAAKPDGSLRGVGIEFVARQPFKNDENLRKKIEGLCEYIKRNNVVENSPRTSFHVHCNVKEMTPLQVYNCIVGYWLLEPMLMEYCGPDRRGSLFCLQLQHAESVVQDLQDSTHDGFNVFHNDAHKYGAINLAAITRYGSLEFRGMRGSTDPDVLFSWSFMLQKLMETLSTQFKDPGEVMEAYRSMEARDFVDSIMASGDVKDFVMSFTDIEGSLLINSPALAEFAYGTDWEVYRDRKSQEVDAPAPRLRAGAAGAAARARAVANLNFDEILAANDILANVGRVAR